MTVPVPLTVRMLKVVALEPAMLCAPVPLKLTVFPVVTKAPVVKVAEFENVPATPIVASSVAPGTLPVDQLPATLQSPPAVFVHWIAVTADLSTLDFYYPGQRSLSAKTDRREGLILLLRPSG